MIGQLTGTLIEKMPPQVMVDCHGVGYELDVPMSTFYNLPGLGETVRLLTHLVVREDAHVLFGFASESEKQMFGHLISVNGVGPSTALVVLSYLSPEELRHAIVREDTAALQAVKGIGGKTAQRLILELRDKLKKEGEESVANAGIVRNTVRQEALSALVTLGIAKPAAEKSVDAVLKKAGSNISLEELVKHALKNA